MTRAVVFVAVFLLAAAVFLSAPVVEAQKNSKTIRIGFLGNTNPNNTNTRAGGGPALFAARLAVSQINNRTDLLPNTTLVLINNNTNSDAGTGDFMAYWQIQQGGVVAMIGEYNSGVSVAIAQAPSRFYKVPMVSYGSTSPDFTTFHNTQYPYFLRMCPSQNLESALLAYVIASQGWNRIGLVYTTDSPGIGGAQSFQAAATKLGIQVVGSAAFPLSGALTDVYFAMSNIKASGATILFFIGAITDFQSIMKVCSLGANGQPALGLSGPGYQWIGLHSYMYTTVYTGATGIVQYQYDFVQGMIGLQNFADLQSDVYQQFAAAWAATPPQPDIPSVVPTDPYSFTIPGDFGYDAMYFIAHALDRMESEFGVNMNVATASQKALFLAVLKNVTFAGITGPVAVDQNGDRFAPFNILNFQGKLLPAVGTVTTAGVVTMDATVPIQYMGGYKAVDHIIRGIYIIPASTRNPMLAFTVITIVIVLGALAAVVALSDRSVMKAASPPFIASMLVGVCLLVASMFPRIVENYVNDVAGCKADLFLTNYGYTLIVGSLLVKTYRVDSIFRMRQFQQTILTNVHLFGILGLLMLCQTALLLGLIFGDSLYMKLDSYDSTTDFNYCSSDQQDKVYPAAIMSFRFFLLLVTAVYTFRIRNIPDDFNESKQLGMTVYNLMFLSVLLPIIDTALGRGKGTAVIAYGIAIFGIALVTSGIMLIPKFVNLFLVKNASNKNSAFTATGSKASMNHSSNDNVTLTSHGSAQTVKPSAASIGGPRAMPKASSPAHRMSTTATVSATAPRSNNSSQPSGTGAAPSLSPSPPPYHGGAAGIEEQTAHLSQIGGGASSVDPPASPRVHVSSGVSNQLLQILVNRLQDGATPASPSAAQTTSTMVPAPSPASSSSAVYSNDIELTESAHPGVVMIRLEEQEGAASV